jgi:hypothetical protein
MKSALNYSSALRHSLWQSLLILLCAALLVSGCKSYGPIGAPDFDPTYKRTLEKNEQLLFSSWTELVDGTYMEGEQEFHPSYDGVMLLTNERVLFAKWNVKQQRYEPLLWAGYANIAQTKMHNNILLQYIAIVTTDGTKFTFMLGTKSVEAANAILLENINKAHENSMPVG